MAGPPPDLTPAAGAFVINGGATRRALTAAMLDLASRGEISFREESELLGLKKKVGIAALPGRHPIPSRRPAARATASARSARPRPMRNASS